MDWIREAVNLVLERLDRIAAAIERLVELAEEPPQEPPR